jgi:predicted protein tyrosine phosphatase
VAKKKSPKARGGRVARKAPEILVLSREDVEHYEPASREVCISISDPRAQPAGVSPTFLAVLRMQFDDLIERGESTDILFAADHARAINEFIDQWGDVDRVVLHCNMGVSRSPAVALGLCDLHGWATASLERSHPGWNRLVRSVMVQSGTSGNSGRSS